MIQVVEKMIEKTILQRELQIFAQSEENVYLKQQYELKEMPNFTSKSRSNICQPPSIIKIINSMVTKIININKYLEKIVEILVSPSSDGRHEKNTLDP